MGITSRRRGQDIVVVNPNPNLIARQLLEQRGLQLVPLNTLIPDASLYSALILQPLDRISASKDRVGPDDRQLSGRKLSSFLTIAAQEHADLVLCPEYYASKDILLDRLNQGDFPEPGRIWILGVESITPAELAQLPQRAPNIEWIVAMHQVGGGMFLDPVFILLNSTDTQGQNHKVCFVQFKIVPMADPAQSFERNHLICGTERFIINNNDDQSVLLACLLCSDSLGFDHDALPQSLFHPYLLVHLQANFSPIHDAFREYRTNAYHRDRDMELIAVNWAAGFGVSGHAGSSSYGDSCIFIKSGQQSRDDVINQNHQAGLYYSYLTPGRAHKYFFNYNEHLFLFRTTKVSQRLAQSVQQDRTGPQMVRASMWCNQTGEWLPAAVSDGFAQMCQPFGDVMPLGGVVLTALDQERLLILTNGRIENADNWWAAENLLTSTMDATELHKRVSVDLPDEPEIRQLRNELLGNFSRLRNDIIPNGSLLPERFSSIPGDWNFNYQAVVGSYHVNVRKGDGTAPTTACFVGNQSAADQQRLFERLYKLSSEHNPRLLMWWVEGGIHLRLNCSPAPRFGEDPGGDLRSISREDR